MPKAEKSKAKPAREQRPVCPSVFPPSCTEAALGEARSSRTDTENPLKKRRGLAGVEGVFSPAPSPVQPGGADT